jgi:hypothetical protein
MAAYLGECEAGADRELIGFPHLLLCMGVVLQTKAFLYGFHFDNNDMGVTPELAGAFLDFIGRKGGNVAN